MSKEINRFSIYLGIQDATKLNILSDSFQKRIDDGDASKLTAKEPDAGDFDAYYHVSQEKTPRWLSMLSTLFEVPAFSRKSPASLLVFEEASRIFAVAFGYGSKLLNERYLERDFGIKVAINAVAEDSLRSVQKANVAAAIQQYGQSAFKSRFGTFGGQSKFEILRKVSGATSDDSDVNAITGGESVSLTTSHSISDVRLLAKKALQYYLSDAYKKTDFAVVDDFKAITDATKIDNLNSLLISNLIGTNSTFELCLPQLNPDQNGYVKMLGIGAGAEHPDISLKLYKTMLGDELKGLTLDDLKDDAIALFSDEHDGIGRWPVYKCLIGGLEDEKGVRHVLNEARWYQPSAAVTAVVEGYFEGRKADADPKLPPFEFTALTKSYGKKGKTKTVAAYEDEETYNARVAATAKYVLFDQKWHKAGDGTFSHLEVCDLFDPDELRMLHIKRTSRQPTMISYLFEQGQRAADMWQRDDVREQFIAKVRDDAGDAAADKLANAKPKDIVIEFVIADHKNAKDDHTISFLGKLAFESKSRDIELRGFTTKVRFITLPLPT